LLVNEQIELLQELNQVVRGTESFRAAETTSKLIRMPTGDGMALLFFHNPEEPVRCALEISRALREHPTIQVRMGVHSGPVNRVTDVNDKTNIAGSGINVAQRVLDCSDAGHILLSGHVAEDLAQYRHWQPYLHDLGECEVKHGLRLHLFNLYKDNLGNPQVPEKLKPRKRWKQTSTVHPVSTSRSPKFLLLGAVGVSAVALVISSLIFFHRTSSPPTAPAIPGPTAGSAAAPVPEKSIAVLPALWSPTRLRAGMSVSRHDLIACACGKHRYPKLRIPDNIDEQTMCDLELNFLSRDVPMRTWSRRT